MSDHYQYVDTYYTSSYPDGESVNSGATRFNYGYPSQACYGFGQATASSSSASVFVGPNVVRFCACTCNFACTCLILVQFLITFICRWNQKLDDGSGLGMRLSLYTLYDAHHPHCRVHLL